MTRHDQRQVRDATEADVPNLLSLARGLSVDEQAEASFAMSEATLRSSLFGQSAVASAVIAERRGEALGFAFYSLTLSIYRKKTLFLESLYVHPSVRGQGLGRQIVEYLSTKARAMGCDRFWGFTFRSNSEAVQFYRKAGFHFKEDWVVFSREPLGL